MHDISHTFQELCVLAPVLFDRLTQLRLGDGCAKAIEELGRVNSTFRSLRTHRQVAEGALGV